MAQQDLSYGRNVLDFSVVFVYQFWLRHLVYFVFEGGWI